jgi:pSer/pThr/pTyr-binding forkhead associated (FHA) protein
VEDLSDKGRFELGELRPLGEGDVISLTKERLQIGRHRLCDVVLHSTHVAPVHCQLFIRHQWWYVRDLSGTQDTKVNALPIGEARLHPGDILWIGSRHKYEVDYDPDHLAKLQPE